MSKPFNYTYQFDDKSYGVYILLAQETEKSEYQKRAEAWLDFWTVGYQGQKIKYTPGGLAFLVKWGSLPLSANTSFLAFIYSDWLQKTQGNSASSQRYQDFAISQIDYILGDNPSRRSYMIGYGDNYPQNPHHRTAHGSWLDDVHQPQQTRNLLIGALVGGPDGEENWEDDRNDWVRNEVGVSYNAGLAGALAKMYDLYGGEAVAEITFPQSDRPEIYVESKTSKSSQGTKINLTIVNKSASPAMGIEKPMVRIFYATRSQPVEKLYVSTSSGDCANSTAKVVKLKQDSFYSEVTCDNTIIYPGGKQNYKKQVSLIVDAKKSSSSVFNGVGKLFAKPCEISKICLFDGEKLIWESDE